MIDTASPFSISAVKNIPAGYSVSFCYKCLITPTGLNPIYIDKTSITFIANPLDCSEALSLNNKFKNPNKIAFHKNLDNKVIISSFNDIFKNY